LTLRYKLTAPDDDQNWDAAGARNDIRTNTDGGLSLFPAYDPTDGWMSLHLGDADMRLEPCAEHDQYCGPDRPQWVCHWFKLNVEGAHKMECMRPIQVEWTGPGTPYPDQNVPRDWELELSPDRAIVYNHFKLGGGGNCFPNVAQYCWTESAECHQSPHPPNWDPDWYCTNKAKELSTLYLDLDIGLNTDDGLFGPGGAYVHAEPADIDVKNAIWLAFSNWISTNEQLHHLHGSGWDDYSLNTWTAQGNASGVVLEDIEVLAVATRQRFPASLELWGYSIRLRMDVDRSMYSPVTTEPRWRTMGTMDVTAHVRARLKPEAYDTEQYPCLYPWYKPDDPYDLRFAEPPDPEHPEAPLVETMLERAVPIPVSGGAIIPGRVIWRGVRASWPFGSYVPLWRDRSFQTNAPRCCESIYTLDGVEFAGEWDNYDQERVNEFDEIEIEPQPQRFIGSAVIEVPGLHNGLGIPGC
jgi:hypothetical protein